MMRDVDFSGRGRDQPGPAGAGRVGASRPRPGPAGPGPAGPRPGLGPAPQPRPSPRNQPHMFQKPCRYFGYRYIDTLTYAISFDRISHTFSQMFGHFQKANGNSTNSGKSMYCIHGIHDCRETKTLSKTKNGHHSTPTPPFWNPWMPKCADKCFQSSVGGPGARFFDFKGQKMICRSGIPFNDSSIV